MKRESKKSVLIIDPDLSHSKGISIALKEIFDSIEIIKSPSIAFSNYTSREFTLIVSEIDFPVINGLEVIKRIKFAFPKSRLLILTAYWDQLVYKELERMNDITILAKPVNISILKTEIKGLLNQ